MSELWGVKICLLSLTRLIAYARDCCYHTSCDVADCYPSLRHNSCTLMSMLRERQADPPVTSCVVLCSLYV